MTYTYDPALNIPDFLKRDKTVSRKVFAGGGSRRGGRKVRLNMTCTYEPATKLPKSWRDADKVRVVVGAGWPASFPPGTRVCLVQRGKTNRSKFVRVREWPCYYKKTYKMARDVFESSVVGETK